MNNTELQTLIKKIEEETQLNQAKKVGTDIEREAQTFHAKKVGHEIEELHSFLQQLKRNIETNANEFSFVSERFGCDEKSMRISHIISSQKKAYANFIERVRLLERYCPSKALSNWIFSISKQMLLPALQYGYHDNALDLLQIMGNPKLVGDNKNTEAGKHIKIIASNLGRRGGLEGRNLRAILDGVIADGHIGTYGDVEINDSQLKELYNQGKAKVLQEKQNAQAAILS